MLDSTSAPPEWDTGNDHTGQDEPNPDTPIHDTPTSMENSNIFSTDLYDNDLDVYMSTAPTARKPRRPAAPQYHSDPFMPTMNPLELHHTDTNFDFLIPTNGISNATITSTSDDNTSTTREAGTTTQTAPETKDTPPAAPPTSEPTAQASRPTFSATNAPTNTYNYDIKWGKGAAYGTRPQEA
jgi:hypothetical protein